MAQLLISKINNGSVRVGDITNIRASGTPFGGLYPDVFVLIDIPDATIKDFRNFRAQWVREISFTVVASNTALDGYRLKMTANQNASATVGKITKDEAEQFILSWNGSVFSWGDNEVIFDITILNAIKSAAFWDVNISGVVFNELSYSTASGIHTIQADYSAIGNNPTYIEQYIEDRGANIISHTDQKVIVFEIDRGTVRERFQADIDERLKKTNADFRFYVSQAVVNAIIANGGRMTALKATAANYIKDKLSD